MSVTVAPQGALCPPARPQGGRSSLEILQWRISERSSPPEIISAKKNGQKRQVTRARTLYSGWSQSAPPITSARIATAPSTSASPM